MASSFCKTIYTKFFRVKPLELMLKIQENEQTAGTGLRRELNLYDVIAYGIGSTVGAGLFVVTGKAARDFAGPAVSLSFVFSAIACLFSALCYAEFASRVPVSGSAYSFAYASVGEGIAWFIGWNLTLEYGISAAAIARGWSNYFVEFCKAVGAPPPWWLYDIPLHLPPVLVSASPLAGIIVFFCTILLLAGVKESSKMNIVITIVNLLLVGFICFVGGTKVETANWEPFMPYGLKGVFSGAGFVFFSFIGFDCVCTLAEELKNPQRDLPVGIISTLAIVTILYVAVSLVITGMVNYYDLDINSPLSSAFSKVNFHWASIIVALGSASTLTATTLCSLFGQPRIFYRMAKDGLLFEKFGIVSEKNGVPTFGTIVTGIGAGILGVFLDIDILTDMISIGTLLAFSVVCISVLVLRYRRDSKRKDSDDDDDENTTNRQGIDGFDRSNNNNNNNNNRNIDHQHTKQNIMWKFYLIWYLIFSFLFNLSWMSNQLYKYQSYSIIITFLFAFLCVYQLSRIEQIEFISQFKCPWVPWIPALGIMFNMHLIMGLPMSALYRLLVWTFCGFAFYFFYGIKHSTLEKSEGYKTLKTESPMMKNDVPSYGARDA